MITTVPLRFLRLPPDGEAAQYAPGRTLAVWALDEDFYIVVAGKIRYARYLVSTHPNTQIPVQIIDAPSLESARSRFTETPRKPLLNTLRKIIDRARTIENLTHKERGFLAALEYATTGVVKDWPERVYLQVYGEAPEGQEIDHVGDSQSTGQE